MARWLASALCLVAAAALATPSAAEAGTPDAVAGLPPGERWLEHVRKELLPFWNQKDAWGSPPGNFPSYRCNDGRRIDPARPCKEAREAPSWMKEGMGQQYVRMMSRQTYFYGVAYHLLGDPELLARAREGVEYLRAHAFDPESGSAATLLKDGRPAGPPVLERTAQDLAYAQVGLAMYWYLTRDPAVLRDLQRLKDHVFQRYWDADWGMLRWTVQGEDAGRQELVAQLDQLNAYMLLVTPNLPEPQRRAWTADLRRLAGVLYERFHAADEHLFWGTLGAADSTKLGARHNDFGHTAKTLWMLERIARVTGDEELAEFATAEAREVLRRAQLKDGVWGSRPLPGGAVDPGKEWWIFAELDQLSATLALADPTFARPLARTYPFWLKSFVDHDGGEVWGWVGADGRSPGGLKIHLWKSGYHSAEHALVAYLTTQALRGEPATLYYAFPEGTDARPYYFEGRVVAAEPSPLPGFDERRRWKVTFEALR